MHACWQTKGPETASSELSGFLRDSWHVPVQLSHRQQCVSHGAGGRGGLPVVFSIFFFTFPIHATLSMPYLFVLKLMFQFFLLGSGEVIIFLTTTNLVEDLGIKRSRSARTRTAKRSAAIITDQRHRCLWKWRMWSVCFYSSTILELLGWNRILEQADGLPRGASSFKEGN